MSSLSIYSFLPVVVADYIYEFIVEPQDILLLNSIQDSIIHEGYGVGEERISFSDVQKYYFTLNFTAISNSVYEYIQEFYSNPVKAAGDTRSFYYTPNLYFDTTNTYTVRFTKNTLEGFMRTSRVYGFGSISLKILGGKT